MLNWLLTRLRIRPGTNKWFGLGGETYEIEDLGRAAVFLLPSNKMKMSVGERTVEEELCSFLAETFGGFSITTVPYFRGFWRDSNAKISYDECCLCEVSFVGKERISVLLAKLSEIASIIGEQRIYFKAGQYSSLMRPKQVPN